ncbi:MAG TPA: hypothetical protein PKD53_12360, partial [Chloroflexaceae bacterium]|nr:hypothetical protein [Chloroflexaceae bacterium]
MRRHQTALLGLALAALLALAACGGPPPARQAPAAETPPPQAAGAPSEPTAPPLPPTDGTISVNAAGPGRPIAPRLLGT